MKVNQMLGTKVGLNPLREPGAPGMSRRRPWREVACPVEGCLAAPGQSCRRYVAGLVGGQDIGGGYWRTRKTPHPERTAAVNPP